MLPELKQDAVGWCQDKNWLVRLPLLVFIGYILVRHFLDPSYSSIMAPLNLGIHEFGHLLFSPLGQTMGIAGGTILQLGVPVFGFFNFYAQRDFFAIALTFGWLSVNLYEVARYIGDARSQSLQLVSIGNPENVIHDWNYMLGGMNLLVYDTAIAWFIRVIAAAAAVLCVAGGAWLLRQMAQGTGGSE